MKEHSPSFGTWNVTVELQETPSREESSTNEILTEEEHSRYRLRAVATKREQQTCLQVEETANDKIWRKDVDSKLHQNIKHGWADWCYFFVLRKAILSDMLWKGKQVAIQLAETGRGSRKSLQGQQNTVGIPRWGTMTGGQRQLINTDVVHHPRAAQQKKALEAGRRSLT